MGCGGSTVLTTTVSSSNNHHARVPAEGIVSSSLLLPSDADHQQQSGSEDCRQRRIDENNIVQNFVLIWLDANIDESSEDYKNSIKHLRRTVHTIETFQNTTECVENISKLQNERAFLIVSGALCKTFVPEIHNILQLHSIYVFCHKRENYETWAKDWSKIKGVFIEITSLCDAIRESARHCDEDSVVITALTSLNQQHLDPLFMYTQLFKEIILEIDFDEKKEIYDLADYASKKYADSDENLKIIQEFAHEYKTNDSKPIWWYTRECFIYHMLNKALCKLQVETLLKMGVFIRDLHQNIKRLHSEQISDKTTVIKVYRGKTMTQEDFENKIKLGGLMSFNNFLSTSNNRNVALHFVKEGIKFNTNRVAVLFQMTINRLTTSAPFACINKISYFQTESEVLFTMHTVFRVQEIKEIKEVNMKTPLWQINLTLTSESDDQLLVALTQRFREEIIGTGWQRMAHLLWKLGENDKAEQVYNMLLEQTTYDEEEKSFFYNQIGLIENDQGHYKQAIEYFQKSLDIKLKTVPANYPSLTNLYANAAETYSHIGDYAKALSLHEQALEICTTFLPPNHIDFIVCYNNIGELYRNMGDYRKAAIAYVRALEIEQINLPPNHPDLATTYNNMGLVDSALGDYTNAAIFYEKSLEIMNVALPPNHPSLGALYNNIGHVHYCKGDHAKAISSFEKALDIQKQTLPSTHPSLATFYNNIGEAYRSMGDYPKALSYYEQSFEIRQVALPPDHPDFAQFYNNTGFVYYSMGEYSKSLASFEKAKEIWEKSLPPTHPYIALVNCNVEDIKTML